MNVELETWLAEMLEKGLEVRQLFPQGYRNWCMYYYITIQKEEEKPNYRRVISLIVEAKRDTQNHQTQDMLIMDLNKIYVSTGDIKTETETQELKNKKLIFIPRFSKEKTAMYDNYSLTGIIKLYKETAST